MTDTSVALSNAEPRETTKVAALDIGSNSFHLVVARIVAGSVQILHKVKQRVRLADGLDKDNVLSKEAIERGLTTLEVIAESLKDFEPDSVRTVATYTLRKAKNANHFLKKARKVFPYPIEVISGNEEARLIYNGVAHTNHEKGQRLVIDIGGGSTEFIIGQDFDPQLLRSLQMGCVSYTQRFFAKGELTPKAFKKAITAAQQELEMIDKKFMNLGWQSCIGCSGTARIITTLAQELDEPPMEGTVTQAHIQQMIDKCCEYGHQQKLGFTNLSEERKPVLAAGLAILMGAFNSLKIKELTFSPAALREGVIYEMEDNLTHPDIRGRTAESLATRYDVDVEQANRVYETTMALFDVSAQGWKLDKKEHRNMLGWAALLHEVGLQINSRGVQRHSGYILQNVDMPGFNQEQQNLLATLTRFHRKKIRPGEIPEFTQFSSERVSKLLCLLRLGVLLNIKRQDGILPAFSVNAEKMKISLELPEDWLSGKPIFSADIHREVEQIKVLGIELKV